MKFCWNFLIFSVSLFLIFFNAAQCVQEQEIKSITKKFADSVISLGKKIDCKITTLQENNGCVLKVTTDKCDHHPTLHQLQRSLFPQVALEKISGGFIQVSKLQVEKYSVNVCDKANPFFQTFLSSHGSYELAERYFTVNQLKFNLKFPALNYSVYSLTDVSITEGQAKVNLNGEIYPINVNSPKGKRVVSYEMFVDILPFEDIITKFQFNNLEDVYGKEIVIENRLSLLSFTDAKVKGYSAPSQAFEFEISGKINGPDVFQSAAKVFLVLQKYKQELTNVKCLLFVLLENQSPSTLTKLLHLGDKLPDIPFLTPVEGKMAMTISNEDFVAFNNDGIKETADFFVRDIASGNIINKGERFMYKLKHEPRQQNITSTGTDDEGSGIQDVNRPTVSQQLPNTTQKQNHNQSQLHLQQLGMLQMENLQQEQGQTSEMLRSNQMPVLVSTIQTGKQQQQQQFQSEQSSIQQSTEHKGAHSRSILLPTTQGQYQYSYQQNTQQHPSYSANYRNERSTENTPDENDDEDSGNMFARETSESSTGLRTKYTLYEMLARKGRVIIQSKEIVAGKFGDLITYILGDSKDEGKNAIPLDNNMDAQLDNVVIQRSVNSITIKMGLLSSKSLTVLPGFLDLNDIVFDITRSFGANDSWGISMGTSLSDSSIGPQVDITYNEFEHKYFLIGEMELYSQAELIDRINQSPLTEEYQKRFPELTKFPYKDAKFIMQLNKEGVDHVKIKANAVVLDEKNTPMESIIWREKGTEDITTGLLLKDVSLDDLLYQLYKKRMLKTCWLTMKDIVLVFSSQRNQTIEDLFSHEVSILRTPNDGSIFVIGKLQVNLMTGCLDDSVCNFIKNHITHDLYLQMQGNLLPSYYTLSSQLLDVSVSLGDVWGVNHLEVVVRGTNEKDSGMFLTGNIIHKETKHSGTIFVGEDKITGRNVFKLSFEKPWEAFLGFSMVTLRNMTADMDISGDTKLDHITFDGTMEIGNTDTPVEIRNAKAVIGMKTKQSAGDVVYGAVKLHNITNLEKAFTGSTPHPFLQKITFNEEIRVCFTSDLEGYVVEEFGSYKFNPSCNGVGEINTYVGNVTSRFEFSENVKVHFQPKTLKYNGGKLLLQESEKSKEIGPVFLFQLTDGRNDSTSSDSFVSGYMKTVGYQGYFNAMLQGTRISQEFLSSLFNEVKMRVNITASFEHDMNDTKYVAEIDKSSALPKFTRNIKKFTKAALEMMQYDVLLKSDNLLKEIFQTLEEIKQDRAKFASINEEKKNEILKKKLAIDTFNSVIMKDCTETCGKKCVTALDWDHECSDVRGQKFGCLKWKDCQAEAADTRCIAKCEGKKIPASISAHDQRDDIRYLAEEMANTKRIISRKQKLIRKAETFYSQATIKLDSIRDRLHFLTSFDSERKDLFAFSRKLPTSEQLLNNMTIPCFNFKNVTYLLLGQTHVIESTEICMKGKFYWEFARAIIENADKRFETLAELKDELAVKIFQVETSFKDVKENYRKQLEKEEDNEDDDEDEEIDDVIKMNNRTNMNQKSYTMTFINETQPGNEDEDDILRFLHASKRSFVSDAEEDKDVLDATETKIADYVIKGAKTSIAFETDAPWTYMNKKRGITIPALGMLEIKNSTIDDHCIRRSIAVEHFEDLAKSLYDVKKTYEHGKKALEGTKLGFTVDKRDIDNDIIKAKKQVKSPSERKDMIYWFKKYKEGLSEYVDSANKQLEHQNKVGLKYWTTQLNSAVRSNIAQTPSKYFQTLRQNVLTTNTAKRSKIEGEDALDAVTKEFINIAEKEPLLSDLDIRLSVLSKHINQFKSSSLTCAP